MRKGLPLFFPIDIFCYNIGVAFTQIYTVTRQKSTLVMVISHVCIWVGGVYDSL